MGLLLKSVVPWGRNIEEYRKLFLLSYSDMRKKIAGFGDGPASFNVQASERNADVTSFDPIYCFSKEQLRERINEVRDTIISQMEENAGNYVWCRINSIQELEYIRMSAMDMFLEDYEKGKEEGRYICHSLPDRLPCDDGAFDIGLSSHFLLMYTSLGLDFHIAAISEMLRACKEIRIFPLCDLDSNSSELTEEVIKYFSADYKTEILKTDYEFQRGADKMLRIRKKMKCSSLEEVRENIDRIDDSIIRLIAERTEFVKQAASFKRDTASVKDSYRVEAVIKKVREKAEQYGVSPDITETVYRNMISGLIELEMKEFNSSK